jgi:hypothetical protein
MRIPTSSKASFSRSRSWRVTSQLRSGRVGITTRIVSPCGPNDWTPQISGRPMMSCPHSGSSARPWATSSIRRLAAGTSASSATGTSKVARAHSCDRLPTRWM